MTQFPLPFDKISQHFWQLSASSEVIAGCHQHFWNEVRRQSAANAIYRTRTFIGRFESRDFDLHRF
jgi:hypothetical protein